MSQLSKKYVVGILFIIGVAVYFGLSFLHGKESQGRVGATSSGTFSITLKVEPCVQEVAHTDTDNPDKLCFSAPGIQSLVISCDGSSDTHLAIYPKNNQFCIDKNDQSLLMKNISQLEGKVTELMLIAPD